MWRDDEDLDINWLMSRLRGEEPQTENMKAGIAFHKALENIQGTGEFFELSADGYSFSVLCDITTDLPPIKELSIERPYGDLLVRGRVDGIKGLKITDYKTTGQFDADRLMEGYQWRYYLDMMECSVFTWKVFVISEYGEPKHYDVKQFHELTQKRYLGLREDCDALARDYAAFAKIHLPETKVA